MYRTLLLPLALLAFGCSTAPTAQTPAPTPVHPTSATTASTVYDFTVNDIDGNPVALSQFQGKVLLIVNVASQCGYTPQYETLQGFYEQYKDKGVVVLGFPANNFGGQEPGSNAEIKSFCTSKFNVTFPMFSKISVKGADQHPLYAYLTQATGEEVKWNFHKFLIGKDGKPVRAFPSRADALEDEVLQAVGALL